jgi:hypothetical protein
LYIYEELIPYLKSKDIDLSNFRKISIFYDMGIQITNEKELIDLKKGNKTIIKAKALFGPAKVDLNDNMFLQNTKWFSESIQTCEVNGWGELMALRNGTCKIAIEYSGIRKDISFDIK